MQFTDEYNALFKEVIRPVCASYGYEVIRGDDFYTSGQIIEDITRSIRESALIIADVTPDNANVFYEVGYAHGIGKPTILLSDRKRDKKLPFDIAGFRTLFYDNTISGKGVVEERLKKHLDGLRPGGTG
jgi:nucleoside 2-deoxyribosyltransferase